MAATARPLHLRLFLEGIEVPVIAAQTSCNPNGPAAAAIQIIPLNESLAFKPRTLVHLFFLDSYGDFPSLRTNYKLLFTGEVVGHSFIKSPASRSIVLQCLDHSSYWDSCHTTAIHYGPGGNVFFDMSALYASNKALFDDIVQKEPERLAGWLKQTPETPGLGGVTGLAGGIIRVLEAMAGIPKASKGVNDFFTVAQLRCRILEQIVAEENDKTASNLVNAKVFDQWIRGGVQNIGQQTTFRDMLKLLCSYIYYDSIPNPVAMYSEAGTKLANITKTIGTENKLKLKPKVELLHKRILILKSYVETEVDKSKGPTETDTWAVGPTGLGEEQGPTATIGASVKSQAYVDYWSGMSDSIRKSDKELIARLEKDSKAQALELSLIANFMGTINEEGLAEYVLKIRQAAEVLHHQPKKEPLSKEKSGEEGVIHVTYQKPNDYEQSLSYYDRYKKAISILEPVDVALSAYVEGVGTVSKMVYSTARLHTQIIRPDCWFAPAPRCNVIFPEQYTQLSYDRNFFQEVTRVLVLVYNTMIGQDPLLRQESALAPNMKDYGSQINKAKGEEGYRALMDHERHTGIIPRSEWLSNICIFPKSADNEYLKSAKGKRMSYGERAALFNFFKYRFASRQASIGGRFNPYLVCGFPAVVITQPFILKESNVSENSSVIGVAQKLKDGELTDAEALDLAQNYAKELGGPIQLVGMIGALTHNLDQNGGTTQVSLYSVRQHLGTDDEFLNFYSTKAKTRKRIIQIPLSLSKETDAVVIQRMIDLTNQTEAEKVTKKIEKTSEDISYRVQTTDIKRGRITKQEITSSRPVSNEVIIQEDPHPLVTKGSIDKVLRENVWVPKYQGRLTIGGKGFYGTIVGIEIPDGYSVSYVTGSYKTTNKVITSAPGVSQVPQIWEPATSPVPFASSISASPITGSSTETRVKNNTLIGRAFSDIILYEEVDVTVDASVPIEEVMRPGWFSESYSSTNIGDKIYKPFFGIGSIMEDLKVSTGSATIAQTGTAPVKTVNPGDETKRLFSELKKEEESKLSPSVEKAINLIGYLYGLVKQRDADVETFIRQYSVRPIANMNQILGTADLELKVDSSGVATAVAPGEVGFHTMAIHETVVNSKIPLAGLLQEANTGLQRLNLTGKKSPINSWYDVRKEKRDRVLAYVEALKKGPGFLG